MSMKEVEANASSTTDEICWRGSLSEGDFFSKSDVLTDVAPILYTCAAHTGLPRGGRQGNETNSEAAGARQRGTISYEMRRKTSVLPLRSQVTKGNTSCQIQKTAVKIQ